MTASILDLYNDGQECKFLNPDYNADFESEFKYVLRGYSDKRDPNKEYYFSIDYKNMEGYYLRPINEVENTILLSMLEKTEIPFEKNDSYGYTVYQFSGCNLIDYMHFLYSEKLQFKTRGENFFNSFMKKYNKYKTVPTFTYTLNEPGAVPPTKNRFSDTGFDLTVITAKKKVNELTTIYDTGVSVRPAEGFYYDVVPRSSISKMGYIQSNSVGIIDSGYRGNIMIALTKTDPNIPDLQLPIRIGQLIPRKLYLMKMEKVETLDASQREGDGGINR